MCGDPLGDNCCRLSRHQKKYWKKAYFSHNYTELYRTSEKRLKTAVFELPACPSLMPTPRRVRRCVVTLLATIVADYLGTIISPVLLSTTPLRAQRVKNDPAAKAKKVKNDHHDGV